MPTIIATFDEPSSAQQAVDRLVQSGIDRGDVQVQQQENRSGQRHQMVDGMQDDLRQVSNTWDENNRQKNSGDVDLVDHMLGRDDDILNRQADPNAGPTGADNASQRRGGSVVIVDARDQDQADRVCSLLQECGAFAVNERAHQ